MRSTSLSLLLIVWHALGCGAGAEAGAGADAPAMPPAPSPGAKRFDLKPIPPRLEPKAPPAPPAVAADGARCKASRDALEECVNACWKPDEAACASLIQACEEGHGEACGHAAGWLSSHRSGAPDEQPRILRYLEAACNGGMLFGCIRLEVIYRDGLNGVQADPERSAGYAKRTFAIAQEQCRRADPNGCMTLGSAYRDGWGTDRDLSASRASFARGIQLMTAACSAGDGLFCHLLGVHYAHGIGTPVDKARGRTFLERACSIRWKQSEASCLTLKQMVGDPPPKAIAKP